MTCIKLQGPIHGQTGLGNSVLYDCVLYDSLQYVSVLYDGALYDSVLYNRRLSIHDTISLHELQSRQI
jgi:hypothetical protein